MSRRDHTVREGTSEKHWYTLAAYLAGVGLGIAYMVVSVVAIDEPVAAAGSLGIGLLVISGGGLVVYPALFKDSAYVRGVRSWRPRWWYYLLFGLGAPTVVAAAASLIDPGAAVVAALIAHGVSAPLAAGYYLYQRHQIVGVP